MSYKITKYPDGSKYVTVKDFVPELNFRINSYADLWTLKQIKDVYDYNGQTLKIFIPCLLDAQADRRFNTNESSGLKLVCKFINELDFVEVIIFHPHNAEVVEALIDNLVIIDNLSFLNQILALRNPEDKSINFLSTDAGGYKSLSKVVGKLDLNVRLESCIKSRDPITHKVTCTVPHFEDKQYYQGQDVYVVDDLCIYGGTAIEIAKQLKTQGVGSLYFVTSHLTVNPKPELFQLYDMVFTTNSKNIEYIEKNKLHVVNIF